MSEKDKDDDASVQTPQERAKPERRNTVELIDHCESVLMRSRLGQVGKDVERLVSESLELVNRAGKRKG